MKRLTIQSVLTIWVTFLIGCAPLTKLPTEDPLTRTILSDTIPLPSSNPTLQDLAFTFPVFEMGVEETKDTIKRGGFGVTISKTKWVLGGDGAQPDVELNILSSEGQEPLKVSLTVGSLLGDPPAIYIYERIDNGWRFIK